MIRLKDQKLNGLFFFFFFSYLVSFRQNFSFSIFENFSKQCESAARKPNNETL